jgi:hypothetical protein
MITDLNLFQNQISDLTNISNTRYENLFRIAKADNYYFYNILKSVQAPDELDPQFFVEYTINSIKPFTALSYEFYGTQDLWWLICVVNRIKNPTLNLEPGTRIKVIKQEYVMDILNELNKQNKE